MLNETVFYTANITALGFFLVINLAFKNWIAVGYSLLFSLLLALLWVLEGGLSTLGNTTDSLTITYLATILFLAYGFAFAAAVGNQTRNNRVFRAGLLMASLVLVISLLLLLVGWLPPLPHLLNVEFALLILAHGLIAQHWKNRIGTPDRMAQAVVVVCLLVLVILLSGEYLPHEPWWEPLFARRMGYVLIMVATLGSMTMSLIALKNRFEATLQDKLRLAQTNARNAQQMLSLERQYQHAQEAARQYSLKLATANHDLRQPLASLRTEMDVACADFSESKRAQFDSIFSHLEQLATHFSQQDNSGGSESDAAHQQDTFAINQLFSTLHELFHEDATNKGISFEIVPSSARIEASAMAVMRILSNLISNTLEHSGASRLVLGARRSNGCIKICVLDNGQGLPSTDQERLFEAGIKSPESSGDGLGLFSSQQLAEEHGMRLSFRSTPGLGCTFTLEIPLSVKPI